MRTHSTVQDTVVNQLIDPIGGLCTQEALIPENSTDGKQNTDIFRTSSLTPLRKNHFTCSASPPGEDHTSHLHVFWSIQNRSIDRVEQFFSDPIWVQSIANFRHLLSGIFRHFGFQRILNLSHHGKKSNLWLLSATALRNFWSTFFSDEWQKKKFKMRELSSGSVRVGRQTPLHVKCHVLFFIFYFLASSLACCLCGILFSATCRRSSGGIPLSRRFVASHHHHQALKILIV